jgi:hypothetical protein
MNDSHPAHEPSPCPSLNGRGDGTDGIPARAFQESSCPPGALEPASPGLEALLADPEIAALLDFEPVPRKRVVEGAWTPELQREFIARLAVTGSPGRASEEMGKTETGVRKLYRTPEGASFRKSWHGAIALAKRRKAERRAKAFVAPGSKPPSLDNRRRSPSPQPSPFKGEGGGASAPEGEGSLPGQVLNEYGEWEDEASYRRRGDEARDSIAGKLLHIRRLYLAAIAPSPGKRAAFEILTELPIDWDKAALGQPQADEPYRNSNQREPDMVLMAEGGWTFGECGYGEDKKAELRRAIDQHREEEGLPPVDWDAPQNSPSPLAGEGDSREA